MTVLLHSCSPVVNCSLPQPPMNGSLSNYVKGVISAALSFQCDEGFVPSVVRMSMCFNSDNIWIPSPEQHDCKPVEGAYYKL